MSRRLTGRGRVSDRFSTFASRDLADSLRLQPTMRKPVIAGNWKMFKTVADSVATTANQQLIDFAIDERAMAYTFLKAEGFTVGKSLVENDKLEMALQIKQRCAAAGVELLLPTDHQIVDSYEPIKAEKVLTKTIPIEFTNAGHAGIDIGAETVSHFANALRDAKTIIWNGPMGVFEEPPFDQETIGIAHAVADAADRGATVIVGGGDSVAAVTRAGVAERITHISTGGGATLEFLGGEE